MKSRLKIFALIVLALMLAGASCRQIAPARVPENTSSTVIEEGNVNSYIWPEQGIIFKYPKNMSIIHLDSVLFLNAEGNVYIPQGDALMCYTRIEVIKNTTIEQVLKPYYDDQTILKSKSMKKIGAYNFTRLRYEDYDYDYIVDHYFLQVGSGVLDYKVGYKDNKGDVELTLASLEFNQ